MPSRNGRHATTPTVGTRVQSSFHDPESEAGFAKQIYKLTGAGETILDVLSRTILTPAEADIIAAAWMRGIRLAADPQSPYNAEKLLKDPIAKMTDGIPVPILWALSKCTARLSVNGYNADRVMKMHVQPQMLPGGGVDRFDKLRNGIDAVKGE